MNKIENICNKISIKIANELKLDDENKAVINYGIFGIIQIVLSLSLVVLIGLIFNVVMEALMVSFSISILRKYSGGIHATSPEKCLVIGTIAGILLGSIAKYVKININLAMFIMVIIFILSYYVVFKLAPVASKAKPIKKKEKKLRLKKISIIILNIYLSIVILNIVMYYNTLNYVFIRNSYCICLGMAWQVFSLTKYGFISLSKLDKLLNIK